jgi:hypothetical protein
VLSIYLSGTIVHYGRERCSRERFRGLCGVEGEFKPRVTTLYDGHFGLLLILCIFIYQDLTERVAGRQVIRVSLRCAS